VGYSARKAEAFSGIHGPDILVIVDEASGIEDPIWDAINSLGFAKLLVLGNPIHPRGRFRQLHDMARAQTPGYALVHLTAFDSPYATFTDDEVRARGLPVGLTTKTWIDETRRIYGEGSIYWVTRVLARFPEVDFDQLLAWPWLDRCRRVERAPGRAFPSIAVDISKGTGRDRTVLILGSYLGLDRVIQDNRIGVMEAAVLARDLAGDYGVRAEHIVFDASGWAGTDMERYLNQFGLNGAVGYKGASKGGPRFANQRTRAAWRLRQRLDPDRPTFTRPARIDPDQVPTRLRDEVQAAMVRVQPPFHIPDLDCWPELREELGSIRYQHGQEKLALEPKEAQAMELGRSPDLADGLLMLASLWPDDD
jgi:hypothetical protein